MKISIVTPSLNQGRYIEETIDSVLTQKSKTDEYIIIDGGSQDSTVEIIKKYEKHLHYWVSEPDAGQAHAINKGFSKSSGEILSYINSDDVYFDKVLDKVKLLFSKHDQLTLLYGDNAILYPDGRLVGKAKISYDFKTCLNAFLMVPQPSSFWSRDIFEKLNGFNENFHYCFDYDFFLRIGQNKNKILHIPDLWSKFRVHDSSKTILNQKGFSKETKEIRSQFNFSPNPILRPLIKNYYLAQALIAYKKERGFIPLSSGPGDISCII